MLPEWFIYFSSTKDWIILQSVSLSLSPSQSKFILTVIYLNFFLAPKSIYFSQCIYIFLNVSCSKTIFFYGSFYVLPLLICIFFFCYVHFFAVTIEISFCSFLFLFNEIHTLWGIFFFLLCLLPYCLCFWHSYEL